MIQADVLHCAVCSREVRIVRLMPGRLTLGHTTNPANAHHPVRLSRAATDRSRKGSEDRQSQRRVSDPNQRTIATRGASDGLIPDRIPSGTSSPARRPVELGSPRPGSRSTRSAGSDSAGEAV